MKKKVIIILSYLIVFFNSNLLSNEEPQKLKVGLLAPLSGKYKDLGNSLLYSLQLALEEIGDENVFIVPRDSGFDEKKKLNAAVEDLRSQGINIIIGPTNNNEFNEIKKYNR